MDTMLLRVFQRQVLLQCRFMLLAAQEANKGLQQRDSVVTFYALQNLLNAAANVSKALWGPKGKKAAERKLLRDSISVTDDLSLRDVGMRNHFEHLDERLDRWWEESRNHNHADMLVGSRGMISGFDTIDRFRQFDPSTMDMIFWGQDFNIQKLITEAQTLLLKLEAEANKPH
jgi:hypothetical protein